MEGQLLTAFRFLSTSFTRLLSSSLISLRRRANFVRLSAIASCVRIADCQAFTYDLSDAGSDVVVIEGISHLYSPCLPLVLRIFRGRRSCKLLQSLPVLIF